MAVLMGEYCKNRKDSFHKQQQAPKDEWARMQSSLHTMEHPVDVSLLGLGGWDSATEVKWPTTWQRKIIWKFDTFKSLKMACSVCHEEWKKKKKDTASNLRGGTDFRNYIDNVEKRGGYWLPEDHHSTNTSSCFLLCLNLLDCPRLSSKHMVTMSLLSLGLTMQESEELFGGKLLSYVVAFLVDMIARLYLFIVNGVI